MVGDDRVQRLLGGALALKGKAPGSARQHVSRRLLVVAVGLGIAAPTASAAQDMGVQNPDAYLMDAGDEIALSRSAGPPSVGDGATLLVMRLSGEYEEVVSGENGWTCFTGRAWTAPEAFRDGRRHWRAADFDPEVRAPQCFNDQAAATVLGYYELQTSLLMKGAAPSEVDAAVDTAIREGRLRLPGAGAMSYMLSPRQHLGAQAGRLFPHLMFFTPFATDAWYGVPGNDPTLPMVSSGGTPWAVTVIRTPRWSDGTPG